MRTADGGHGCRISPAGEGGMGPDSSLAFHSVRVSMPLFKRYNIELACKPRYCTCGRLELWWSDHHFFLSPLEVDSGLFYRGSCSLFISLSHLHTCVRTWSGALPLSCSRLCKGLPLTKGELVGLPGRWQHLREFGRKFMEKSESGGILWQKPASCWSLLAVFRVIGQIGKVFDIYQKQDGCFMEYVKK